MEINTGLDANIDLSTKLNVNMGSEINTDSNIEVELIQQKETNEMVSSSLGVQEELYVEVVTPNIAERNISERSYNDTKVRADSLKMSPEYGGSQQKIHSTPSKCNITITWLIVMISVIILFFTSVALGSFALYIAIYDTTSLEMHVN